MSIAVPAAQHTKDCLVYERSGSTGSNIAMRYACATIQGQFTSPMAQPCYSRVIFTTMHIKASVLRGMPVSCGHFERGTVLQHCKCTAPLVPLRPQHLGSGSALLNATTTVRNASVLCTSNKVEVTARRYCQKRDGHVLSHTALPMLPEQSAKQRHVGKCCKASIS